MITFSVLLLLFASLADTASHQRHLLEDITARDIRRIRRVTDGQKPGREPASHE